MNNKEIDKININKNLCVGCSSCVVIAPLAFRLNDESKAEVLPNWKKAGDKILKEAVESCPVKAISLYR